MNYKELQDLKKYNEDNIPNGGIYFNELTNLFYYEKIVSLAPENIERISKKIDEITKHIVNNDYIIMPKYPKTIVWTPYRGLFEIRDNVMIIKVSWLHPEDKDIYEDTSHDGRLIIPIKLEKSLAQYEIDEVTDNMTKQITEDIDKKILKQIKNKNEQICIKKDSRSSSRKDHNLQRAWKLYGANIKVKRARNSCSSKNL